MPSDVRPLPAIGKLSAEEAKRIFLDDKLFWNHPLFQFDYSMDRKAEL